MKIRHLLPFLLSINLAFFACQPGEQKIPTEKVSLHVDNPEAFDVTDPLGRLLAGNRRFANMASSHPHCDQERLREVADEQHPFALILSCADSRVPPELLFDQGIGDLFVIRNAGHVVDYSVLGSIEYAVEHAGVSLVLVLGHENCGAVTAAVEGHIDTRHIMEIEQDIMPAVERARQHSGSTIDQAVRENIFLSVGQDP